MPDMRRLIPTLSIGVLFVTACSDGPASNSPDSSQPLFACTIAGADSYAADAHSIAIRGMLHLTAAHAEGVYPYRTATFIYADASGQRYTLSAAEAVNESNGTATCEYSWPHRPR